MERNELSAWLRLYLSPGVGRAATRRLLARFGGPEAIFDQDYASLQSCVSAAQSQALQITPPALAALLERTWQWLHSSNAGADSGSAAGAGAGLSRAITPLGHPLYPTSLLETEDPPLLLYWLGASRFLQATATNLTAGHCLAMVGSRNPTTQGRENAHAFAKELHGTHGLSIVSGLALGIDGAAHEGALAAATAATEFNATPATIAVVGTGLDRVYPSRHRDLAHRIASHGLLLSEYPLGTSPLAAHFPQRNRIIAGLSQGLLVVKAAPASGSLITARLAAEQGREVFAIPGSIHALQSRGCHALIRQGAKLVETAQDILEDLRMPADNPPASKTVSKIGFKIIAVAAATPAPAAAPVPAKPYSAAEASLLGALGFDPADLDMLVARTGLETSHLLVQLLELELAGDVARLPGGLFQRMGQA